MRIKTIGVLTVLTLGLTISTADAATAWPGAAATQTADGSNVFGKNLSGVSFEGQGVVWAVKNGPSTLYRLVPSGSTWKVESKRSLKFRDGEGDPDTEGVVSTPDGLFVVSERDNDNGDVSSPMVLKVGGTSTTDEWKLPGMPSVAPNEGPEGISWIPDSYLTAQGFRDDAGKVYSPADYPNHGTGLVAVGLEATGGIFLYALQDTGAKLVAKFASGQKEVMDLEWENNRLWATCDNNCSGRATTLAITNGKFTLKATYDRPAKLPNVNLEGFALAPTCVNGKKTALWTDDDNTKGHALHTGSLNCTA